VDDRERQPYSSVLVGKMVSIYHPMILPANHSNTKQAEIEHDFAEKYK
jgi:hypothetical protein